MMSSRFCIHYVSKSGRPSSGHRTGKGQSSSQFPRKLVPKNVGQLYSSTILVRPCLKSCMLGFSIMQTKNFWMSKLGLDKEEELEIKLLTFAGLWRQQGNFSKTAISLSSTTLKPLIVWIMANHGKLLERWEYQTILPVSWEICMQVKKQQLEPCMEQIIRSRSKKEYDRAVCCHPVCLTCMLSTSWEMPGWTSYKLEKRQWEEHQQPQICGRCHSNGRKWRGTKEPLDEGEGRQWKSWFKTKY